MRRSEKKKNTEETIAETDATACADTPKKTKKRKGLKILLIALTSIIAVVLLALGAVYGVFLHYYGKLDYSDPWSDDETWVADTSYTDEEESDGNDEIIDSSMMATDEEMKMYLDQIKELDDSKSGFDVQYNEIGGNLGTIERDYVADYISEKDDVINILLIGNDARKNTNSGRSDVMIIMSICPSEKKIVLSSILRDVYVSIPGHKPNRINMAYQHGGPALLIETIEKSFGLRIDRYAQVNFHTFVETINMIGNISIYLSEAELGQINSHIYDCNVIVYGKNDKTADNIENKGAGYYELNGVQALAYARIRKVDNDFGRTNRQRNVIIGVLNELKKMSPVEWNSLLNMVLPNIRTNLTQSDVLSLVLKAGQYIKYDVVSISIPSRTNFKYMIIDGRDVVGVDLKAIRALLYDNIYKPSEEQ